MHAHVRHHEAIIDALKVSRGIVIDLLPIYPGKIDDDQWSRNHQTMHTAINGVLGIDGRDITEVPIKDKKKMDVYYYEHWIQHQSAAQLCGMPI